MTNADEKVWECGPHANAWNGHDARCRQVPREDAPSPEKDVACVHPDFDAQVIVTRLEDSGLFSADVKVWCRVCALPFGFPESIPVGLDLHGIARSLSGQELRIAIAPTTLPDDWSDRPLASGSDGGVS